MKNVKLTRRLRKVGLVVGGIWVIYELVIYPQAYQFLGGRHISQADIQFELRSVPRPPKSMAYPGQERWQAMWGYYRRIPRTKVPPFGHVLYWEAADNDLGGIYLYYDPVTGVIYGDGSRDSDFRKAAADHMVGPDEIPSVYYRLGEAQMSNGVLQLKFPKGTKFRFTPFNPLQVKGTPDHITIKFPLIPLAVKTTAERPSSQ